MIKVLLLISYKNFVNQQMLQLNRNIDKLVKDFIKNQYKVDWEGRLGCIQLIQNLLVKD